MINSVQSFPLSEEVTKVTFIPLSGPMKPSNHILSARSEAQIRKGSEFTAPPLHYSQTKGKVFVNKHPQYSTRDDGNGGRSSNSPIISMGMMEELTQNHSMFPIHITIFHN